MTPTNDADADFAVVAEDADAEAEVPGLWNPAHDVFDLGAGDVERLAGPAYVGHDRGGARAEDTEPLLLDLPGVTPKRPSKL